MLFIDRVKSITRWDGYKMAWKGPAVGYIVTDIIVVALLATDCCTT